MRAAILLPSSKGQHLGGSGIPWGMSETDVTPARHTVATALRTAMRNRTTSELAKMLGATGDTLRAARAMNTAVLQSPTMPAIERYRGVLYEELAYATLAAAERRRADRSLLIFGALHGVAHTRDPLPAHRLDFTAALGRLGRLAGWWRPQLTEQLAQPLRGAVVWDLLPQEHSQAWQPELIEMRHRYRVTFLDAKGKTVSHWNKLLKGALARHLLAHGLSTVDALESFTHSSGYGWDRDASLTEGRVTNLVVRATSG